MTNDDDIRRAVGFKARDDQGEPVLSADGVPYSIDFLNEIVALAKLPLVGECTGDDLDGFFSVTGKDGEK